MTAHSLKRKWFLLKVLESLKAPFIGTPELQRDEPLHQENASSNYTVQVVRDRQQLYFLERHGLL